MKRIWSSVITLVLLVLVSASVQAQQMHEVTGRVTSTGGQPLPGVLVAVVGQQTGARTNERGEFRLQVPNGDVTVVARAIGYKRGTQRVSSGSSTADFALDRDVLELEGVIVTGQATSIERKNAATAVSVVSADALARVPAVSLENALQGKVIGASINMNNGAPGGGGQIQIRGASSLIGRIDPLIILDGVAISNAVRSNRMAVVTGSLNAGEENGTNRLADINPNDIESVEVLKSAAASAIYGSQATNGVVVITTKRGREGSPRFNFTQRVGTSALIRNQGSRHYSNLTQALGAIGANPEGIAAATAACTATSCPYFDNTAELYGRKDPSYESVMSLSGGVNSTRYYASGSDKQETGIAMNTGARRQSLRANVDQNVGQKITISLGSNLLRSFSQRGIGNNDNAFSSPLYGFAYTPGIIDLRVKDALGQYVLNPFAGGGTSKGSNPFQTFDLMQNNEDVYRLIFSGRANYAAYTGDKSSLTFSLAGGADRYSNENYIRAPQELQFQRAGTAQGGTFPGTIIQGNGTERLTNINGSAVWAFTPGWVSATTSAGIQLQDRAYNDYNIVGRGLGPQQAVAAGAQNIGITDRQEKSRTQAAYGQEELLLFGEKLYLSGAIRGERASLNGDPTKVYYYPRASASYRFVSPVPFVTELKLRTSFGVSGNQPGYGDRFLALTSYGIIGGLPAYGLPATIGNPLIKPERLNELELGLDGGFLGDRMRLEATYYNRKLTDLLVRPQLAPSTGINATTVNGGEMTTKGYEFGLTLVPIQRNDFNWTSRTTWYQSRADITSFPPGVQPFTTGTAAGGFGNAYGRLRFAPGHTVSTIWGNKIINGATVGNTPLADANPKYIMSFINDMSYGNLNFNFLVDYRRGGSISNMTLNLYDEGANTWDYDEPSPDPTVGATLGEYRYNLWGGGANTAAYIVDGSYTKIREVNLSYQLPAGMVSRIRGAQNAKISLSGRNLFIISGYNGFDPEVNNGGNFISRFVDLAPFPPSRSFWLSRGSRILAMTLIPISIPMGLGPRSYAMTRRRYWHGARLGLLVAGIAACSTEKLTIPNYNQPTTEGVSKDPKGVALLASGILDGSRDAMAGMIRDFGTFGRESYNYFPTDGRTISNYLVGIPGPQRLDPAGFAAGVWTGRYQNQRNAVQMIEVANATGLSAAEKSAVAGFAKTYRALELLYVIESRDTLGAPTDIPSDPNSPAPFVARDSVYRFISGTLDEGATDLAAGGSSFPFTLTTGFAGFDTPATFLQFNRAIAARVLAIRGSLGCGATCYTQAIAAVNASFASPVGGATSIADLNRGTYNVYSSGAGDTQNANSFAVDNYIYAHASIQSDAQSGPSGIDARYTRKVVPLASPVTPPQNLNIPATHRFTIYPTPSSPAPIIRNEELMLIRAEANIFTNNFAAAMQDINNIRSVSGGLGPVAFATQPAGLTALLYERRYSLLFEGQRWVDHRRFGLLNLLPLDQPGQFVAKVMPIPQAECDARVEKPNGCT